MEMRITVELLDQHGRTVDTEVVLVGFEGNEVEASTMGEVETAVEKLLDTHFDRSTA